MDNTLTNQIRNKVDIVDIVGERIPLVAKGKNFFGVCPFHDDSNPSMCVSREKQIYTCFSCHATGNVFTFLMNYEHMDFKETLKYLGNRVGIDTGSIHIAKKSTKYDKYYDVKTGKDSVYEGISGQGIFARQYNTRYAGLYNDKNQGIGMYIKNYNSYDPNLLFFHANHEFAGSQSNDLSSLSAETAMLHLLNFAYVESGKEIKEPSVAIVVGSYEDLASYKE